MSLHAPSGTTGHNQPTLVLTVDADSDHLRMVRRTLTRWLIDNGIPELTACDIVLAVNEAAANAVEHAYTDQPGAIEITATIHRTHVAATVTDHGRWRDPDTDLGSLRGRGFSMIDAVTEHYDIDHTGDRTTLTARFSLEAT